MKNSYHQLMGIKLTKYQIFTKNKSFFIIGSVQTLFPASMWTRKDIDEFKANLLREGGEAVIKVNHGETVTVSILQLIKILKPSLHW